MTVACEYYLIGVCLTPPPADPGLSLFSFSDFLTALALLALAFNATDPLYRFRIAIAPIPLRAIAFYSSILVGSLTLLTDVWFAERWPALPWGFQRATIQGVLGAVFLTVILTWLWFAFLKPPSFNGWNYRRFHSAILWRMIRGSDVELAAIAGEIAYLADSLIEHTALTSERRKEASSSPDAPGIADFAYDCLLLLSHRKFCRVVVASASDTAVALMQAAIRREKYDVPLGQFTQNITAEAILNPDSPIYHEDRSSLMSVFSTMQPFTASVYGNYKLVNAIGAVVSSPFDLDWQILHNFNAKQWDAYCDLVLVTFEAYLAQGHLGQGSSILARAFGHIADAGQDAYLLNGTTGPAFGTEPSDKLSATAGFARNALIALGKAKDSALLQMRSPPRGSAGHYRDVGDWLADMLYKIILNASAVKGPEDLAWAVHYNTVWTSIFGYGHAEGAAHIVLFKLRRLLFDEIKHMEELPNFEGARILGICLNVLGVHDRRIPDRKHDDEALRLAVVRWTRRNYLTLRTKNSRVADACMIGSLSFDAESFRIVKSYSQGLRSEPPRSYLSLDGPTKAGISESRSRTMLGRLRSRLGLSREDHR